MASSLALHGGDDFSEPPLQLELVLAYEDKPTAERAKRAVESVFRQHEVNTEPHLHLWRLDVLSDPEMKEWAAREASAADILVVSLHGGNRLTATAETALKQWVSRKRAKPRALVISLDSDSKPLAEANPTIIQLRQAAARSGFAVLLHFGKSQPAKSDAALAHPQVSKPSSFHMFDDLKHRPASVRDWGIND
jgi:hypothetical protein